MRHIHYYCWLCWAAAMIMATAHASDPNDILVQSRALRRQFMAQQLSAVSEQSSQDKEVSLADMIAQVLSLQPPADKDPNQAAVPGRAAAGQDSPAASATTTSGTEPSSADNVQADTTPQAPQKALGDILSAANDSESVPYPMELADVLYRTGKLELAVRYYDIALQSISEDDASAYSWVLFQMANCLRQSDPTQANVYYDQLVRTYPGSVWAAAAQARIQMLSWLETNEPQVHREIATRSDYE